MTSVFSGVDDEIYVLIFGLFSDVTQQTMDVFFLCTLQFSVSFQGFHFKISSGGLEKGARATLIQKVPAIFYPSQFQSIFSFFRPTCSFA